MTRLNPTKQRYRPDPRGSGECLKPTCNWNAFRLVHPLQRPPRRQPLQVSWLQRKVAGKVIHDLDRQVIALNAYADQQDALMEGVKAKIGEYNEILAEKDAKINEADETLVKYVTTPAGIGET